ncbi:50S ribosome-binding GTPase [Skermanella rosea]|uniref:GTPase n=1 Tax=Skermanella rosea TaxID=1817965 RepID=UPI001931C5FF|nr:GTPase [Skermanella rosea]UEM02590.1 50S ribosome-binding GTPase [Skermanella rosea]
MVVHVTQEIIQNYPDLSQLQAQSATGPQTYTTCIATDELALATSEAVARSQAEIERLAGRLDVFLAGMRAVADKTLMNQIGGKESDSARQLTEFLDQLRHNSEDLLQRQRSALKTFNTVLFGRTGAGKSSMITAMARTDGKAVSHGESDWTTDVKPLPWNSCLIYDTPGINGWGRGQSRDKLEARAREAVEVADVVLVCFDTQSQQIEEFAKLAAWVIHYRKPLIAVLNQRNPVWRVPDRVPSGTARANLSRAIAEHAGNIRDELGRLGLGNVPLIAVNSKRAVAARAASPFEGPDLEGLTKQRDVYGCETLEAWSNYRRLEQLLVQAVGEHAVAFRLGALNDQLRSVFQDLHCQFDKLGSNSRLGAETLEKEMLAPLLRLVGYPRKDDAECRAALVVDGHDLLDELEQHRRGAFQAPAEGEYTRLTRSLIEAGITPLRLTSLRNAEMCIFDAFECGKEIDGESVRLACFDELTMRRIAETALAEGFAYLRDRAALAETDTRFALNLQIRANAIAGASGDGWKHSAWALKTGGILAGAFGALGGFAIANFWNPLGWAAGPAALVALLGSAGATLFGLLGDSARKEAESNRLAARRTAMASIRKTVHATYDRVTEDLMAQVRQTAVSASAKLLLGPVRQALELRRIAEICGELTTRLAQQIDELPIRVYPQALLWEVARRQEQAAFPGMANASALYWLGEDWIEDPRGLSQQKASIGSGRTDCYNSKLFDSLFARMGRIFERADCGINGQDADTWLHEMAERCRDDPLAQNTLSELKTIGEDGRPRIHLVGDYNSGKSSFIKRLLIEAGLPAPASLEVAARPTTAALLEYDCNGLVLVDAPGFQSGDAAHAEIASNAFPDASAVIFLFQPNLVLGDDQALRAVLLGDAERGLLAKRDRVCFIVNRADELGVDPEWSPTVYAQLTERKRLELVQALKSRGIEADEDRIVFMASDPYGLVGNNVDVDASAFDAHRAWDGFDHFNAALNRARPSLLASGVARSVLEGGVARLTRLKGDRLIRVVMGTQALREIKRVIEAVRETIGNGQQLGERFFHDLQCLVEDYVSARKDEVLGERDPVRLRIKAEALSQWWTDPALQVEMTQWQMRCAEALESWYVQSIEALSRRMESVEFRQSLRMPVERYDRILDDAQGKGPALEVIDKIGRSLGGATRDVVYSIGKALGVKFKPWGAVKLARSLAKAGAVIAVIGVVVDIAFVFVDEKRQAERERHRHELTDFLRASSHRVVHTAAFGDEDQPGLLPQLGDALAIFERHARELTEAYDALADEISCEEEWIETYRALTAQALERLQKRGRSHV